MINGSLDTIKNYKSINKDLATAIDYLLTHDLNDLPSGLTTINDKITITKLVYFGKEKGTCFPEQHYNHLDMQILLKGREMCYFDYYNDEFLKHVQTPYNEVKDVIKYDVSLRHKIIMDNNNFSIFMPNDVHHPSLKIDDEEIVKLVIKVAI